MAAISFEAFFKYIESKSLLILRADEKEVLQSAFRAKHLRKKQYLLQEGEVCKDMCFIIKGSGRMYSVDEKGHEHTIRFAIENWWLGDYESYNFMTPSLYNIEVLEDSDVLMIDHSEMQKLTTQIQAMDLMVRNKEL